MSPVDAFQDGNGTTFFDRFYDDNVSVTLTAPTVAGGNAFVRWDRNGSFYSSSRTTTVSMNADYTFTAVYGALPPFVPYFSNARIANRVDQDGDGYARQFDIEFDVDSNVAGNYYVKIYEDDGGFGLDDYLTQSATFAVNGTPADYRSVTIACSSFASDLGHGTAEFRLDLYNAANNTLVQTWRPGDDADLGNVFVELSTEDALLPPFAPYFSNAQIANHVDQDGDGYARQFDIEFDVDSNVAGNYYVKIYEDDGGFGLDDYLTQSATFAVNGTPADYRSVTIACSSFASDLGHGTAEFRLDLYNAANNTLVQTWRPSNDPDLGNVLVELSSEDALPPPFAPYFSNARIANRVDQDSDGYARQFDIEFDVDSNVAGNYYVKIYEDDGGFGLDDYLTQSATFAVNGTPADYRSVTIACSSYASDLGHGTAEFRLDLYNAANDTLAQTWRPGNDSDLGNVLVELSSEDALPPPFAPYFSNARIANRVDQDGDGYARQLDIEFDVDSNVAGNYYVKIYEDDGGFGLDDYLTQSATFAVNGTPADYRSVTIACSSYASDLGHGTAEFRLDLYNAANDTLIQTWRPGNDSDLGNVLVELSSEDALPPPFAPYFTNARIANRVDQDGDGYARQFDIEVDVNSNIGGQYYVKVYEDDVFSDDFLLTSPTFNVNGNTADYQTIRIACDNHGNYLNHGTAELKLQLYNAANDMLVQTWTATDDSNLGNVLVELATEDTPNAQITGTVWNDSDADKAYEVGETILAGWTVYLDQNQNRLRDVGETYVTSDANGAYSFSGLAPGTYYVAEELQSGYEQTQPGSAGSTPANGFQIDVVFSDNSLTPNQRAAFNLAVARWSQIITADLPDMIATDGLPVDDVRIDARGVAIDGPGGILGQAAPTEFRPVSTLPTRGFMEFDTADLATMESNGQLVDVILHEMGHVLGIGTIWEDKELLTGAGSDDPRFVGSGTVAEYRAIFSTSETSVPVEGTPAPAGTRDSHWRESVFANELMTGYISGTVRPLSRITVASLADVGYSVNLNAADAYNAPSAAVMAQQGQLVLGRLVAIGNRPRVYSTPVRRPAALLASSYTIQLAGNEIRTGQNFGNRLIPDTTSPVLNITSHSDGQTSTTSTITLAGTASDAGRGNNGIFSITVNGVRANNDTASGSGTANWSKAVTLIPGDNIITVIARDASVNQNSTPQTITITYIPPDTTAPAVAVTFPANNITVTSPSLTVTGTASDSGRGNNGVSSVTVNGVSASGGTASGANTANWSATITLNPGLNTITAVAKDTFNNSGEQQISVTYNPPDAMSPALAITFPANNATVTSPSLTVTGTASDSGRGNNGVSSVTVNGVSASGGTASGANTANWSATISLNPGVNTITAVAKDTFNNSGQQQITVTYSLPDTTPPIVSINSPVSGQVLNASSFTVSGTASDPGSPSSDVAAVQVRVNGGSWRTATGTAIWNASVGVVPGSNLIETQSQDSAGNLSTIASVRVTVTLPSGYVFFDDMENGQGDWTMQPPWGLTTANAHSPNHAWTDSPGGDYQNDQNISLTSPLIDLTATTTATLMFWHRFDLAIGDSGNIWIQPEGGSFATPVRSFFGTDLAWHQEIIDLSSYAGQKVRIYFQLYSDSSDVADGWYVDDIGVTASVLDTISPTSVISSPTSGQTLTPSSVTVSGTADDPGNPSSGVVTVQVRANGGSWRTASGTTSWNASVGVVPGNNLIEAQSQDNAGNLSTIASVSVTVTLPNGFVFLDDMENGQGAWTMLAPWGQTTANSHSSNHSWTDSPGGDYPDGQNVALISPLIDLTGQTAATLTFWHQFDFAAGDSGNIWVLPEGGSFTTPLRSFLGTHLNWHQEIIDLSNYAGQKVQIYFQRFSDPSGVADGWYIDDVGVTTSAPDTTPPTVVISTPSAGQTFASSSITVSGTASDPDSPNSGLASVSINAGALNDGTLANWRFSVNLNPGQNTLVVSATDQSGNIRSAQIVVILVPYVIAWGDNSAGQTNVPLDLTNVVAIAGGEYHSLALKSDGTVAAWGLYLEGGSYVPMTVPAGLTNVVAIAGGGYHNLALNTNGTVLAWGNNDYGQTNVPAGLTNVVMIAGGGWHSLVLKSDGTVVAWGMNSYGQTIVPVGLSNVVAISGGWWHSLALKADGEVVAWGWNGEGETNVPAGLTSVVAIAAGAYHNLALKADGTVTSWGWNFYDQTNMPASLTNVTAVAAAIGGHHSLALKADSTLVAWGRNDFGQTNVPAGLSNVVVVAGGGFHSMALVGGSIKVLPHITWSNPADIIYGTPLNATARVFGTSIPGTFVYSPALVTVLGAGNAQTLSVTFTPMDTAHYLPATATVSINVLKAPLEVTADDANRNYGGANPSFGATFNGFVNGDTSAVVGGVPNFTTTATSNSSVSNYDIVPALGTLTAANYEFTSFINGTLAVNPAALTVTAHDTNRVYGATNPTLMGTLSGLQNNDNITASFVCSATASSPVGLYPVVSSLNDPSNRLGNYNVVLNNGILAVDPATMVITANNRSKLYGEVAAFAGTEFTTSELPNSETVGSVTLASSGGEAGAAVGIYNILPSAATGGTFNSANYTISYQVGTLAVSPAAITITANNRSKAYGGAVAFAGTEFTISGLRNSETVGSVTLASSGAVTTAGVSGSPFSIVPSAATGGTFNSGNYTISYQNGALMVTPAALAVRADDQSRLYGQTNPVLSVSYAGFVNGETVAVVEVEPGASTLAGTNSPVGLYAIRVGGGSDDNYSFVYEEGTLTVASAALTVTAQDAGRLYGQTNPVFGVSYAGFLNGDDASVVSGGLTLSTEATTNSAVGAYAINASGLTSTNYAIIYVAGTLTVSPTVLGISVNPASKIYGASDPAFRVSYSGFVNGENELVLGGALSLSRVAGENVGSYTISASGLTSSNYTIGFTGGSLSISAASLVVNAQARTKVYGAADPALTYGVSGLQFSDSEGSVLSGALSRLAGESVGGSPYLISQGTLMANGNYTIAFTDSALSISKAALAVRADDQSRLYGQTNPVLSVSYAGFVNGETVAVVEVEPGTSTLAGTNSPAGLYAITVGGGSDDNYSFVYEEGTLTVASAALTVTAQDAGRLYGQTNPVFGVSYVGFLNGDDASTLSGNLVLSTGATTNSAVGTYAINASGLTSTNYAITYVAGTLTVSPTALGVSVNPASKIYGASDPAFSVSYSGFVNGKNELVLGGALSLSRVAGENVGSYTISASGLTSSNYTIGFTGGSLSISAASLMVSAQARTKVYGASDPALTYGVSGLQFSDSEGSVLSGALSREAGESVAGSPYLISQGTLVANGNYTIAFTGSALSITKAALTVRADDQSRLYGQPNPVFTGTIVGLQNNDNITAIFTCSAGASSPVDSYSIVPTLNDPDGKLGNYAVTLNNGLLSITAPQPSISNGSLVGHNFSLSVSTALGPNYILEYKNSLADPVWTVVQTVPGTGGTITLTDDTATDPARFYRIHVQ